MGRTFIIEYVRQWTGMIAYYKKRFIYPDLNHLSSR